MLLEQVEIGYFSKTHGVKGQLLLKLSVDINEKEVHAVFVDQHGSRAPLFVSSAAQTPQGLLLMLEDITSVEQARTLLNKKVYAESRIIIEEEETADLEGYELQDKHFGSLGKVLSVVDNGAQDLLVLNFKDREVMLPLVDAFIESIDDDNKIVKYNAPEGLLEIFLE